MVLRLRPFDLWSENVAAQTHFHPTFSCYCHFSENIILSLSVFLPQNCNGFFSDAIWLNAYFLHSYEHFLVHLLWFWEWQGTWVVQHWWRFWFQRRQCLNMVLRDIDWSFHLWNYFYVCTKLLELGMLYHVILIIRCCRMI